MSSPGEPPGAPTFEASKCAWIMVLAVSSVIEAPSSRARTSTRPTDGDLVAPATRPSRVPPAAPRSPRSRTAAGSRPARLRRERSSVFAVRVVVVPPLVRRRLRVALRRVLPLLLAPERGDVEVGPGTSHRLVTARVD